MNIFKCAYWCTTFDCVICATTIIPASKMDSKEKETKCQKNSGVDYSFPISEYAKQLWTTLWTTK